MSPEEQKAETTLLPIVDELARFIEHLRFRMKSQAILLIYHQEFDLLHKILTRAEHA